MPAQVRDVFCQSADGLKIHAKITSPEQPPKEPKNQVLPVVCLPGLTRTVDDFDVVASALANAASGPREVIAVDYRGRGLSDYDPNAANYNVVTEMGDVLAVIASLNITRAIFLGTSRGGIISMLMASARPDLMAGVILNDVGPALEMDGLMKIAGYIADPPPRHTWTEAASGLKELFGSAFPSLTDAGWMEWARRAFREKQGGGLERTYDLKLAAAFSGLDPANPPKPIWDLFDKLQGKPLMLIHGVLSDLLSAQGVTNMMARHPGIELVQVADEGHAPLLADKPTIERIVAFCARCDRADLNAG